jgi:flagellar biogenesis protein FliO
VSTALGLLGIVVFVVCVIAFAAGVTWLVVRLSPSRKPASQSTDSA